uniref:G-protein coupled receptors family 1 profile domain-containing protein n=1 Tax=Scylla olivacea TaxID=85551 RepID=A0A0P4WCN1_SCYOL
MDNLTLTNDTNVTFSHDWKRIILETSQQNYLGTGARAALITVYALLMTGGILGNLILAAVISRRPELRREPHNVYIINLTVSDVSLCVVCMPFTLLGLLHSHYTLGDIICKLVPMLQCTNILVSTATIVAIAADRYFTIVRVTGNSRGRARVPWSVAAIWLVSLAFTLPLFAYYYVKRVMFRELLLYEKCVETWPSPVVKYSWTIALIIMQYVIPILVLSIVHGRIHNYLSSHAMNQRDPRRAQRDIERNRRTTMLLTSVAATFAVCWLPWHVVNLLADFNYAGFVKVRLYLHPGTHIRTHKQTITSFPSPLHLTPPPLLQAPEYFYVVFGSCHAIAMSSACTNPVLYGWLNTTLRNELSALLTFVRVSFYPLLQEWCIYSANFSVYWCDSS